MLEDKVNYSMLKDEVQKRALNWDYLALKNSFTELENFAKMMFTSVNNGGETMVAMQMEELQQMIDSWFWDFENANTE